MTAQSTEMLGANTSGDTETFVSSLVGAQLPRQYKRAVYVFMGLLVVYVIIRGVVGAAARPFRFDEFCTLAVAGQPSLHEMWSALARGFDGQPPLFHLVERTALGLMRNKEVALRLPPILAFVCILVCVFAYVKKRSGELVALFCTLLLLSTLLFHTYLNEARPYSLVVACIAFALVCYQRLPSRFWAVMLGISLFLAESFHYYAVFAMVPFGLAEAVLLLRTRRFRWPVWMALGCAAVPLVGFWPLLSRMRSYYGPHTFAPPLFSAVRSYYGPFFLLNESAPGIALAVVAVAGVGWSFLRLQRDSSQRPRDVEQDVSEGVLLVSLIALPFIVFVLVRLEHGVLLGRYVMECIIGIAVGIGAAVSVAGRKAVAIFGLLVFCVVGVHELTFWRNPEFDLFTPYVSATSLGELRQMGEFVQGAGHNDLPVVVSDLLLYTQLVYYSSAVLTNRLVYLADERRELDYARTDNASKTMLALRDFFPVRVEDYSEFTAAHPQFLLYSVGTDWYQHVLTEEGSTVLAQATGQNGKLYLVKMKEDSH